MTTKPKKTNQLATTKKIIKEDDGSRLSDWYKNGKAVRIRDLAGSPYGFPYDKYQKLPENHIYNNSRYVPNWDMFSNEGNWLVNELVNSSRNYLEAEVKLWSLSDNKKFGEATDTVVAEEVYKYFSHYEKNHNGKETINYG